MCFLSWANSTARCRRCFVAEFFQVYIVFLVVAIFCTNRVLFAFKFSSPLRDVSHLCDVSIIDLSKMIRASFRAFYDQFSHETYKHHASTVSCSESKWKNPPGKSDHSRQKQTTRWKHFFVSIIILGHEYTGSANLVAYQTLEALKHYHKLISTALFIINHDSSGYYKLRQRHYKLRQVLQITTIITITTYQVFLVKRTERFFFQVQRATHCMKENLSLPKTKTMTNGTATVV